MATEKELVALGVLIRDAFALAPYPGDDNIAPHECDECEELREAFRRKDWRTIDPGTVRKNYDKLVLLTHEARRSFLPAYLLVSLKEFSSENDVLEFTIYNLCPEANSRWFRDAERQDYERKRRAVFSERERADVVAFLELAKRDIKDMFTDAARGLRWWSAWARRAISGGVDGTRTRGLRRDRPAL